MRVIKYGEEWLLGHPEEECTCERCGTVFAYRVGLHVNCYCGDILVGYTSFQENGGMGDVDRVGYVNCPACGKHNYIMKDDELSVLFDNGDKTGR